MKNQITIREANSKTDTAAFWEQLHSYHERDIFPNPKDESLKHFLNDAEYRAQIEHVHNRPQDNCYYLFFQRNGQDIGFALPVIFTSEDGKCFIMEFCVYPEFRGNGTGRACAAVLLDWAKARGARYAELNYGGDERRLRFWRRIGFVENGVDEWGEPLMLLPPAEAVPFHRGTFERSHRLAAFEAGKRLQARNRRGNTYKIPAETASAGRPRGENYILHGQARLSCRGHVQRRCILFDFFLLEYGCI